MITKQKYVEYLVSTPINYTCTNLAEHLEGMSHDAVSDFLKRERLTASHLWELVAGQIEDSPDAYLIIGRQCARQTLRTVNRDGKAAVQWR